jgi:hypothetical protein
MVILWCFPVRCCFGRLGSVFAIWFRATSVRCSRCPFFDLTAGSRSGFSGSRSRSHWLRQICFVTSAEDLLPCQNLFFFVFRCCRVLVLAQWSSWSKLFCPPKDLALPAASFLAMAHLLSCLGEELI